MVGFHPIGKIEPSLDNTLTSLTAKPYLRERDRGDRFAGVGKAVT